MKKLRYGIIGSGSAARVLHLPQLRRDPRVDLVWCADVAAEAAAQLAGRFRIPRFATDYKRLLDEQPVDAVSICTPHDEHFPAAMAAIRRGVHVCCEKPLGISRVEAEALAEAADAAGVRNMVHYVYRFSPAARLLRELIAAGELGEIVQIHGHYAQSLALGDAPMSWRFRKRSAGSGALGDLCSHLLDLARWWGGDVRRVFAHLQTVVPERRRPDSDARERVDVDDLCALIGEFVTGATFQLTASRVMYGHKNEQRVEVSGTQGAAIYRNKARCLGVCVGPKLTESTAWKQASLPQQLLGRALRSAGRAVWVQAAPPARCRVHPITHFIDAILGDTAVETDFREGARVYAVMEAAQCSAATGRWVDVPAPLPEPPRVTSPR